MDKTDANGKQKQKRDRLSVDLDAYPDVKAMFAKAEKKFPGTTRSYWTMKALREFLPKKGFGKAAC